MAKIEKLRNSQFNMLVKKIRIRYHYLTFMSSLGLITDVEIQY